MDEIDLDITNYSDKDIEFFFRLDEIPNYTADDITKQVYTIRTELMGDRQFPQDLKRNFIEFIESATKRLYDGGDIKYPEPSKPLIQETTLDYPEQSLSSLLTRKTEIVKHPAVQYVYSDPSTIYKGDLNPLNNRILTRSLTIDSKFRENWSTSKSNDFTINLPTKLSKIASMQLTSVEFPLSFYNISASYGNNTFRIKIFVSQYNPFTSTTTINNYEETIIFPDGNYSTQQLIDYINNKLNSFTTTFYQAVSFSYDINTGRVTATLTEPETKGGLPYTTSFELYFNENSVGEENTNTPVSMTLGYILGFYKGTYLESMLIITTLTGIFGDYDIKKYISEGVANTSPIDYVYLAIEDFNQNVNNGFISATNKYVSSSDIIARITVTDDFFTMINSTNRNIVTDPREYFGPVDISRMRIRVYDCYGRLLDMNNADFSFCLTMKQIYNL